MKIEHPKFLIVVIDGLRADMVSEQLTPNLAGFGSGGCHYSSGHSVFPSETRVVATALATGSTPGKHGLVANKVYDPSVFENEVIDTGNIKHIDAGYAAYGGRLVTTPSLGEVLAQSGLSVAVVSSGSGGTTRLVNPMAQSIGHFSLCMRDWSSSTPAGLAAEILNEFGPVPEASRPNILRTRLQTDIFLKGVFPRVLPDVSILWYTDPDYTSHQKGIGSAENHEAIRSVDDEFGRLVDWWRRSEYYDQMQLIVLSDHGHITSRRKVDIKGTLADAGFRYDTHFGNGADYVGKLGYSSALWVRNRDYSRVAEMVGWLQTQSWCGVIFTSNGNGIEGAVPGTFDRSLVLADHARAPEIYYIMSNDDNTDSNGIAGGCCYDGNYPEGGSVHGGLHEKELNTLLMAQGSRFRNKFQCDFPAGVIDIAPTVLHLLGVSIPPQMGGRVLGEAIEGYRFEIDKPEKKIHTVGSSSRQQSLQVSSMGASVYLDKAWVGEKNK